MRCATCRTQLHDWFDTQGAAAMPAAVTEHVRDCSDCRAFIKNWNAIELGLQTVRDQAPPLSPDFTTSLRTRLAREEARRTFRFPFPALPSIPLYQARRLAVAALALIVAFLAVRFSGSVRSLLVPKGATVAVTGPSADRPMTVKSPISPELPIANTSPPR